MTDWPAFVSAILDAPDDDRPRVIAADFLQEQGDEARAEFIRMQIAIETTRKQPGWLPNLQEHDERSVEVAQQLFRLNNHDRESKLDALRRREAELLRANALQWCDDEFGPLGQVGFPPEQPQFVVVPFGEDGDSHVSMEFRRGFVSHVRTTAADWQRPNMDTTSVSTAEYPPLTIGQEILRREPVERIELTDGPTIEIRKATDGGMSPWLMTSDPVTAPTLHPFRCNSREVLVASIPGILRAWGIGRQSQDNYASAAAAVDFFNRRIARSTMGRGHPAPPPRV